MMRELSELPAAQDPAVQRYFSSRVNWFFLFAALVMYSIAWPTLPLTHELPAYTLPVVAAFASLPLALAWAAPTVGWAVSVVSAQVIGLIIPTANGWPWSIQVTHLIVLLVLTTCTYLRGPLTWLPVVWVSTCLVIYFAAPGNDGLGWAFGLTFLAIVVALIRFLVRSRRQLRARTEETELAESQKVVLEERARIARDLHDVVAHRMSVVVVMAQTARYRLSEVSDEAAGEFDEIASAARTSLNEVRQLLGVLRLEGDAPAAPNPGLDDIEALVDATRRTGAEVTLVDELDHSLVGDTAALVVYRIIQESLANATRHAPGSRIDVRVIAHGTAGLEVGVRNSVATAAPMGLSGGGAGIPGMIDRAKTVGGTLGAGPTPDGGFAVRALIPLGEATIRMIDETPTVSGDRPAIEGSATSAGVPTSAGDRPGTH
nr:histidine kinase [Gordonia soli]